MYLSDHALALTRADWREYDIRFRIFTRDHGLIDAVVAGGKKPTTKLAPHMEPLSLITINLARRYSPFWRVIAAERIAHYPIQYIPHVGFVWHYIETLLRLLPPEQPEYEIFDLTNQLFTYLSQSSALHHPVRISKKLTAIIHLKLLHALGYFPGKLAGDTNMEQVMYRLLETTIEDCIVPSHTPHGALDEKIFRLIMHTVRDVLQEENKSAAFLKESLHISS